jgi:hypothetical protein
MPAATGGMAELSAEEQEFSDALRNDEAAFDVLEEPVGSSGLLPLPLEYSYAEPAQPTAIADEADVRRQLGRQWDTVEDMKARVAAWTRARGWSIILDVKGRRALCVATPSVSSTSSSAPSSVSVPLSSSLSPPASNGYFLCEFYQRKSKTSVSFKPHYNGIRECGWRLWWGRSSNQYNLGDVATLYSRLTAPHLNHHMQLEMSGRDVEVARSISDIPTEAFSFLAQWVKACMPASTLRKVNTLTRRHHTQSCMISVLAAMSSAFPSTFGSISPSTLASTLQCTTAERASISPSHLMSCDAACAAVLLCRSSTMNATLR